MIDVGVYSHWCSGHTPSSALKDQSWQDMVPYTVLGIDLWLAVCKVSKLVTVLSSPLKIS